MKVTSGDSTDPWIYDTVYMKIMTCTATLLQLFMYVMICLFIRTLRFCVFYLHDIFIKCECMWNRCHHPTSGLLLTSPFSCQSIDRNPTFPRLAQMKPGSIPHSRCSGMPCCEKVSLDSQVGFTESCVWIIDVQVKFSFIARLASLQCLFYGNKCFGFSLNRPWCYSHTLNERAP